MSRGKTLQRKVSRSSIWSYQGFLEKYNGNVRREMPKDNHEHNNTNGMAGV